MTPAVLADLATQMEGHMHPRSEEFRDQAAECEEIAKRHGGLIKQQYEQLAGQWLFLAEHNLIVRDPVFLCAGPHGALRADSGTLLRR